MLVTSGAEILEHLAPIGAFLDTEPASSAVRPRDELDLESAKVLDALPSRGSAGTVRIAQRAGLSPAATVTCLGQLATGGFVERCDDGWRLRRW